MSLVDNGELGPVWKCRCGVVLDYEPDDVGEDDGRFEELQIMAHEGET